MKNQLNSLIRIITILNILIILTAVPANQYHSIRSFAAATSNDKSTADSSEDSAAVIWPKGPKILAKSAIVMEASTGMILYEKKINSEHYPASITKIMTTLLAIENSSLNETVKFSHNAVFGIEPGSSNIGITVGEELTMEQCLYGIMLESANEVSNAVAEHIAGDTKTFTEMMNQRAKELGCKNTNFVNAHGLFEDEHHTTAYDMALISKEALKNPIFRKVTSTKSTTVPPTNLQKKVRYLNNHQQMLTGAKHPQYKYEGVIGGKTGYTQKARYTLATFAERNGLELICIIMRDDTFADQYTDTTKLLDYAFKNFKIYNIAKEEETSIFESSPLFTKYSPILNKASSPLKVCTSGNVVLPVNVGYKETKKEISFYDEPITINEQNVVGKISYTYGDRTVGFTNIIYKKQAASALTKVNLPQLLEISELKEENSKNLKPIIITVIIIVLGILYLTYYFAIERPKAKRRKAVYDKHRKARILSFDHDLKFK